MHEQGEIKIGLKSFYNQNAEDRNLGTVQDWKSPPRENFLKHLKDENKRSLLEIGAGTGKDSLFFKQNGFEVVAVDLSDEMVKLCKAKGIEAYELDFYRLSGLGRVFDSVWSINSLLHVRKEDLPLVLSEISKVLKPSGLFYMGVYGGKDWDGMIESETYHLPRYFSLWSDDALMEMVSGYFDILSFDKIITGDSWDFQSLVLRKAE